MRTIIAGGRDFTDDRLLVDTMNLHLDWLITTVISGTANGADDLGERWAIRVGIPVERFPAKWKAYGRKAGPLRNQEMAANADALVAFWDGESRGTANMISTARKAGLKVHVVRYGENLVSHAGQDSRLENGIL